jgi:hypothetical protein
MQQQARAGAAADTRQRLQTSAAAGAHAGGSGSRWQQQQQMPGIAHAASTCSAPAAGASTGCSARHTKYGVCFDEVSLRSCSCLVSPAQPVQHQQRRVLRGPPPHEHTRCWVRCRLGSKQLHAPRAPARPGPAAPFPASPYERPGRLGFARCGGRRFRSSSQGCRGTLRQCAVASRARARRLPPHSTAACVRRVGGAACSVRRGSRRPPGLRVDAAVRGADNCSDSAAWPAACKHSRGAPSAIRR